MNTRNPRESDSTMLDRIERYSRSADWSAGELREELLNEGIDPDELIKKVREKIEPLVSDHAGHHEEDGREIISNALAPNLLSFLRQQTTDTPSKIAQKLGITVPFMKSCSDFVEVVPRSCKEELIERAANVYSIERCRVSEVVEHPKHLQKAALRDKPYTNTAVDFEQIVKTSGMDIDSQRFWLGLAREEIQ